MALSTERSITITTTGATDHFDLPRGTWVLSVHASSWGEATLQNKDFNSEYWRSTKDANGPITITANDDIVVLGGRSYRLNVSTLGGNITFSRSYARN